MAFLRSSRGSISWPGGPVERFRQEARLIARVRHPNLIDIFDIGELPDGRLYYVMEYLAGQALSSLLEKKRLTFREVIHIIRQLCAGLNAAHQAGIVHRDLKPDNLFLVERAGEQPLVKLVDFGIAKTVGVEPTIIVRQSTSRVSQS